MIRFCLLRAMTFGLVLGAALAAPPLATTSLAAVDVCQAPDELAGSVAPLPRVAAKLKPGSTLRVLAVGSATMLGPNATLLPGTVTSQAIIRAETATPAPGGGAAAPIKPVTPTAPVPPAAVAGTDGSDAAFPRQMAVALQSEIPGLKVDVTLRGGRGLSAAEMLEIIRKELASNGPFQLVLWQTGTVEAVRNTVPGEFAQTLADGAEAIDAAGADLVLIDPQYSRFLQTNSNLDPYAQAMQQTASLPGVLLFHRYDVMRGWASDGRIDLERTPRADRLKTVELLHHCLGQILARMVITGAHT